MKIGIQGVRASFHEVAARHLCPQLSEALEAASFQILAEDLNSKKSDLAVMAIENSIAGSILPNYTLMEFYGFNILAEIYLRIDLHLMALPGQQLFLLKSVHSHPMAIYQCRDFLGQHSHLQVFESHDTADSARLISVEQRMGESAIASQLAADLYGLEILRSHIENNGLSYTRFLLLSRSEDTKHHLKSDLTTHNKASLRFETPHAPGSLALVLQTLAKHRLNMTKIQSVPIAQRPSQYSFHVDIEWPSDADYTQALNEIETLTINLINFGSYQSHNPHNSTPLQ